MQYLDKFADKVSKPLKSLVNINTYTDPLSQLMTENLNVRATVSIQDLTLSCTKTIYVRPELQLGDQDPIELQTFGFKLQSMRQVELKANKEKFKAKLFMKDDTPTIDKLKVRFVVSDTTGREQMRAAFKEIDLAQHLGNDYIEQVYDLELE